MKRNKILQLQTMFKKGNNVSLKYEDENKILYGIAIISNSTVSYVINIYFEQW